MPFRIQRPADRGRAARPNVLTPQFLSATSAYAFVKYLTSEPPRRSVFWFLTATNFLLVYSHYWGWFVILAELSAILLIDRSKLLSIVKSTMLVGLLFTPWAVAVAAAILQKGQATQQIEWMGKPDSLAAVWLFGELDGAPDFPHSTTVGLALFGLPILLLIYRTLISPRNEYVVPPLLWLLLVAVPIAATMGIGYAPGRSVWGDRHMSVVAIPYFVLIGIACSRLPWPRIALAVQCVVMLWAVEAGIESLLEPNKKFQWRALVDSMIATGEQPIVVHTLEPFRQIPISFYSTAQASQMRRSHWIMT